MMKQKYTDTNIQGITDRTAKTKTLQLLTDGPSKMPGTGLDRGTLGFVTDKKGGVKVEQEDLSTFKVGLCACAKLVEELLGNEEEREGMR